MEFVNYYFKINKPYGVICQFTDRLGQRTLSNLYNFPKDVYPIGRLDLDSEGLLLLSNDKKLTDKLLNPKYKHEREYFVQVEGIPESSELKKLEEGMIIQNRKTFPAIVKLLPEDFKIEERIPTIRFRKNIPTSWLKIILSEGKNRQVRKMTAKIGYPTLRLIRTRICNIKLDDLKIGEVRELNKNELIELKRILNY